MITYALLLTLSTFSSDSTYYVDSAKSMNDCHINMQDANRMYKESPQEYLLEQNVREKVENIMGHRFECIVINVERDSIKNQ